MMYLAILLAAASLSALSVRAMLPLLQRYALARPNARSSHSIPTPQGAGIAIIAATLLVSGCAIIVGGETAPLVLLAPVAAATLLLAFVGAIDDLRPMPVLPRLLLQGLAAGLVLASFPDSARLVSFVPLWLERAALFLAIIWFVNLVNFMDGLDLITVAEVVPVAATLAILGLLGLASPEVTIASLALCAAMIGFAPFNRPVARVFLGDVGSLPIGLLLAWMLIDLAMRGQFAAALLLPLYYLADATLTLLRRLARGERIWVAHRSHFYQQATVNGFSVLQVSGLVFGVNAVLAALALVAACASSWLVQSLLLAAGAMLVGLMLWRFARKITAPLAR
jgi:UDP-N-acetylmuramyl pentapeptide phosphotransferase/UDP-N-acetylglucosamine-1-phosphate transferase